MNFKFNTRCPFVPARATNNRDQNLSVGEIENEAYGELCTNKTHVSDTVTCTE